MTFLVPAGTALLKSKGSVQHDVLSWRCDSAQLNLKCHMNYPIIFTETNSFFSETSNLITNILILDIKFLNAFK